MTGVLRNIIALYGVHLVTFVLPLLTVPFLARVLGPGAWGAVAFAQAFGALLGLLVEYGFDLAGARAVARDRDNPARLAALLGQITGAKLLLGAAALVIAVIAQQVVPALGAHPALLWASVALGLAQGASPLWFYQGLERLPRVAAVDVTAKAVGTVALLTLVRGPADAWLVPALAAAAATFSAAWGFTQAVRTVGIRTPTPGGIRDALRLGWTMFVFRGSAAFYSSASTFLLGLFVPATLVGYYAGAERLARAAQGLLQPLSRALYPRYSRAAQDGPRALQALLPHGARLMLAAGGALSAALLLGAPLLVRILLGTDFEPATPVLRVLAALPLLIGVNIVLGLFWLVPLGLDGTFNGTVALGALLNAALIVALVPHAGPLGMAVAVIATEVCVFALLARAYRRTRRTPPPPHPAPLEA
ncbi:oligosaccharide flippase family protein [Deinococcus maricopensis]|uniref:Polysaccharide biosynthesis protein n=1 Tax=Deinococcus maricopensis (strain DSM 21211 / LMG 22137 / NRRL B-23946 / LB-34) TaxID=709986 RepID=E8U3E0_DEIML|nr:oligosaccharide flippase family protein [Deinococcus maricopensis]ADV65811.1 polysaccharide biosynthesis protein [Deinococcus maricopensis DSM 21211]